MLRHLKVLFGQMVCAAGIHMDQTSCLRAFADGFHDEPANNVMVLSKYMNDIVLTPLQT